MGFEAARLVFDDVFALDRLDDSGGYGEAKYVLTGMANSPLLTVVYTERGSARASYRREGRRGMSDGDTTIVKRRSDGTLVRVMPDGATWPLADETDWQWLRGMTEEEVEAAALGDPDAQPLTEERLARMRRVPRVRTLRRALGLTQEEFAARYQIPLGTLRDWEQARATPDQPARAYLKAIAGDPEGVRRALAEGAVRQEMV